MAAFLCIDLKPDNSIAAEILQAAEATVKEIKEAAKKKLKDSTSMDVDDTQQAEAVAHPLKVKLTIDLGGLQMFLTQIEL